MRIGDLIEIYHHIPRYDEGNIRVGQMGKGIVIDVDYSESDPIVTYLSENEGIKYVDTGFSCGLVVTIRVIK